MYLKNISFSCFFFFTFPAHQGVSHPKTLASGRASARCLSAPSCHTADGGSLWGGKGQKKRGEGKGGKKQAMDRGVLLRNDHGNVI